MWILLAVVSSGLLGLYDISKKESLVGNNVLTVLFLNTLFCALLMCPTAIVDLVRGNTIFDGTLHAHLLILLKSFIVLSSWILGYFSIKHLPLTIAGPINATRPVMVLIGALLIFGERLNLMQWGGVILGLTSLYLVSRLGKKEGISARHNRWLWLAIMSMLMGAISGLYDKYLLRLYQPLQVQAWYTAYQCIIMGVTVLIIKRLTPGHDATPFRFRWTIPLISIFLTCADVAYFYSLSCDDAMISVISMIRRGSVLVSFLYGVAVLREKNIRLKLIDLSVLILGLVLLILGSQ